LKSTKSAAGKSFKSLVRGFLSNKKRKSTLKFYKSATEPPEVRMSDVTEYPLLTLAPELVSWQPRNR